MLLACVCGWLVGRSVGWFVDCLNMTQMLVNSAFNYFLLCSMLKVSAIQKLYIDNII